MRRVSAREANQGFSKLLAEVRRGNEVVITSYGEPVAKLVPFRKAKMTPERRRAIREMLDLVRNSELRLGGRRFTRDEMHER